MCSNKIPFNWTDEHTEAFKKIKNDMLSTNGLFHHNTELPIYLVTDASGFRCGATLYQLNKNNWEPIGYFSKVFNSAEQRVSSRHRELYGLVYAVKHFEYYLIGRKFTAVTDHKSLLYLFREKVLQNLSSRLANALIYLLQFDMDLTHLPGKSIEMQTADALSRFQSTNITDLQKEIYDDPIPDKIFTLQHFPSKLEKEQTQFLKQIVTNDIVDEDSENYLLKFGDYMITKENMRERQTKCNFTQNIQRKLDNKSKCVFKKFSMIDNILYHKSKTGLKVVLPMEIAVEFASYCHHLYIHPGAHKCAQIISKNVYIKNAIEICKNISKNCLACIQNKPMAKILPSQYKRNPMESIPFSKTAIDLYDLGKPDSNGKRYLLTMICHLTHYLDGIPLSTKTDSAICRALTELFLRHGVNGQLISDNGGEFNGQQVKNLLKLFNIRHSQTASYASRSNGLIERSHREILIKQKLLGTKRKDWSYSWPFLCFILNNQPKESLDGLTSCEALHGRPLYNPFDVKNANLDPKVPYTFAISNYLNDLLPALQKFHLDRQNRYIENYKSNHTFKKGDFVLMYKPNIVDGKLSRLWYGPVRIMKNLSPSSYILKDPITKCVFKRGCRHIRPLGLQLNIQLNEKFAEENSSEDENASTTTAHQFEGLPFNHETIEIDT